MKKYALLSIVILSLCKLQAQYSTYPVIYSWVRNLTGAVGFDNIPSNVLDVNYDASNVYITADCIPGYDIGPWNSNPNTAENQNFIYKITRNPTPNTGTLTAVGNGHTGIWSNGVSIYDASDAMSYNNAGVWYRNAYYWEGISFDSCLGHPAGNGEYHHHVNPICLYDETDSTRHSPIIGYAFDGYPVYGTFAYANADGTGGIKRMTSSYVVSTATTRTNGPAVSSSYPAGCFLEDWIYTAGAGTLDVRNGRFCVTPEYPNGTYCYFATLDPGLTPTFPYTMYDNYYGVVTASDVGPSSAHNTVPTGDTAYTVAFVPAVTISASANPACSGSSVTFTPVITNGGPSPTFNWKVNGVSKSTDSIFTTSTLSNNDTITCSVLSNAYYLSSNNASSNTIIISIASPVTPSVSISTPQTTICSGTGVTFTATPTNGGSTPAYQWLVGGTDAGTNSATFSTSTLTNGAVVSCVMTSDASCASPATATSNAVTITISGSLAPSVSISTPQTTICAGTGVTFTATPTNGGSTPAYQWLVGGTDAGTNSATFNTSILTNGAVVSCVMTSDASCASPATATSNAVTITISGSLTPSVSINTPQTTICSGTGVTFTATPTNGGSTPAYQWLVGGTDAGTNSATFSTSTLTNGAVVSCVMTSDASCASPATATSNAVTITISGSLTPSVSISTPQTTICAGTGVTFTATPTNGGSTPAYQWLVGGTDAGTNSATFSTSTLTNGAVISCVMTSDASCASPATATSNAVNMTISGSLTPSVSISTPQTTICSGTGVTFTATPTNGGSTPAYQWLVGGTDAGTNSATFSTSTLTNGAVVSCVMTSDASCASPATATSNSVTIAVNTIPSTPVATANTPVCANSTLQFGTSAITGASYQWTGPNGFTSSVQNPVIDNPSLQDAGPYSLIVALNSCNSAPDTVNVVVNASPAQPNVTQAGNVLTSSAATGNQWLQSDEPINGATAQSYTVISTGWYAVEVSNNSGCSITSDSVFVTPTGVQDITLSQYIKVVPNPFSSAFVIEPGAGITGAIKYTITDYLGRTILQNQDLQTGNTINMGNQAAGIYLLTVYNNNQQATFKIVKVE